MFHIVISKFSHGNLNPDSYYVINACVTTPIKDIITNGLVIVSIYCFGKYIINKINK